MRTWIPALQGDGVDVGQIASATRADVGEPLEVEVDGLAVERAALVARRLRAVARRRGQGRLGAAAACAASSPSPRVAPVIRIVVMPNDPRH